jgi:hypothetical protein
MTSDIPECALKGRAVEVGTQYLALLLEATELFTGV